ncbi:hypothetical protein ACS0PU_006564 [Formica fusca]
MNALSIEEKIFLIECFYSRGKNYAETYRGFCSKYGSKKVSSQTILRRIIDNFIIHGTLNDRRHDLQFFKGTVNGESYKELLETKFFPHAKKRGLVDILFYARWRDSTPYSRCVRINK